jgi:hypothetical protein
MKIEFGALIKALNPTYEIIAAKPQEAHPGAVVLEMTLPVQPPLTLRLYFDRNAGEEFLSNMKAAMDTAKGLV